MVTFGYLSRHIATITLGVTFFMGCAATDVAYVPPGPATTIIVGPPPDGSKYSIVMRNASQETKCEGSCLLTFPAGSADVSVSLSQKDRSLQYSQRLLLPTSGARLKFHERRIAQAYAGGVLSGILVGVAGILMAVSQLPRDDASKALRAGDYAEWGKKTQEEWKYIYASIGCLGGSLVSLVIGATAGNNKVEIEPLPRHL